MNLTFAALLLAISLPTAFLVAVLILLAKQKKKMTELSAEIHAMQLQWNSQSKELNELRAGALGVAKRVKKLESELSATSERQEALELHDPDGRLYNRAMKLVELGADIDEVVAECELPRAEAELLINLRRGRTPS